MPRAASAAIAPVDLGGPGPEPASRTSPWSVRGPVHGQDGDLVWLVARTARLADGLTVLQIDSEARSLALAQERALQLNERATTGHRPPAPYTAEELERDNPFNQWLKET